MRQPKERQVSTLRTLSSSCVGALFMWGCFVIADVPEPAEGSGGTSGGSDSDGAGAGGDANGGSDATGGASSGGTVSGGAASGATGGGGSTAAGGADASGGSSSGGSSSGGTGTACVDPCDCDDDGVLNSSCDGMDCCDVDDRVFPDQTEWFAEQNRCSTFDYNCQNGDERRYPDHVECSALVCDNDREGFFEPIPPCGERGTWGTCTGTTLNCLADITDSMRPVECH